MKMKIKIPKTKFISEFKDFIMRGNVLDMAIGVIIATSFGKITTSLTNDVLMPFLGWLIGDMDLTELNITLVEPVLDKAGQIVDPGVVIGIGTLLSTILDFVFMAFVIFVIIKLIATAKKIAEAKLLAKKEEEPVVEEVKAPTTEELLTEILAEMKKQNEK